MTRPSTSGTVIQITSISLLAVGGFDRSTRERLAIPNREAHDQEKDEHREETGDAKLEQVKFVDLPRQGRRLTREIRGSPT